MTNSYAIIRAIAKVDGMSYAEKFAGTMIALHLDRKKNQIAVKQEVMFNAHKKSSFLRELLQDMPSAA